MKKQLIVLFTLVTISLITFTSCEPFIQNKITIRNLAAGDVKLNLRGNLYDISAGQILVLNDFKKGTFEYKQPIPFQQELLNLLQTEMFQDNLILNAGTEVCFTLFKYTHRWINILYTGL